MNDYSRRIPEIALATFIAEGVRLIGRVVMAEGSSIWYNAVLRADLADIFVGKDSNVQDGCVIHVEPDRPTIIGRGVTVGHNAVLHAATVDDNCIVGMGAILLDGCRISRNSIVGAGSLVPPGRSYPENSLLLGSPAKVARTLTEEEIKKIAESASMYRGFWESYARNGIGRVIK